MIEYSCPRCLRTQFELTVLTNVIVVFLDDDHEVHEGTPIDVEFDGGTHAKCLCCGFQGPLGKMKGTRC